MKVRAERGQNGSTPRCARVAANNKAFRLARQLKLFLEKTPGSRVPDRRQRRSPVSLDGISMPAVRFAVAQLRRITPPAAEKILTKSAWNDLHRDLSARLALALTPTLRLQQTAAKAVARSLPIDHNGGRRRAMHGNVTLLETIIEFPGLLETAAQLISAWIDAQRELFVRLLQDKADLCSSFLRAREPFRIAHVRPRLSDPHDGARTATMVEFIGDRRVIYKPRRPDREKLWLEALRWLNRNGIRVSFRVPKMLARGNYVWMEFLRTKGCKSSAAVRLFYFRWGAQAALAQILRASDLHRDNWLAIGAQPILVDAELIGDAGPTSSRGRQSLPALFQTGLLPLVSRDRAGFYRGIAPFDATIPKSAPAKCWPRYKRVPQRPSKYVNDLVRGFDAVASIFATPGPARQFFREIMSRATWNRDRRVLLRASAAYARLLRESFEARNMVSPSERWRRLVRECCVSAGSRRIGVAEARALLRCDIPKFRTRRKIVPVAQNELSAAIAELKDSSRLLRRRVLLGTRIHRAKRATGLSADSVIES
jgi:lantibiotic modifying enzyme